MASARDFILVRFWVLLRKAMEPRTSGGNEVDCLAVSPLVQNNCTSRLTLAHEEWSNFLDLLRRQTMKKGRGFQEGYNIIHILSGRHHLL